MDIQTIIVGVIILTACVYVGKLVFNKVKSVSSKSSCGSNCGCDTGSIKKTLPVQIKRNQ